MENLGLLFKSRNEVSFFLFVVDFFLGLRNADHLSLTRRLRGDGEAPQLLRTSSWYAAESSGGSKLVCVVEWRIHKQVLRLGRETAGELHQLEQSVR